MKRTLRLKLLFVCFLAGCASTPAPPYLGAAKSIDELSRISYEKAGFFDYICWFEAIAKQDNTLIYSSESAFKTHDSIDLPSGKYTVASHCGDSYTSITSTILVDVGKSEDVVLDINGIHKDNKEDLQSLEIIPLQIEDKFYFWYFEVRREPILR